MSIVIDYIDNKGRIQTFESDKHLIKLNAKETKDEMFFVNLVVKLMNNKCLTNVSKILEIEVIEDDIPEELR